MTVKLLLKCKVKSGDAILDRPFHKDVMGMWLSK